MTRLLGLLGAQPFLVEGKLFGPREAHEMGLVHELVSDAAKLRPAALAWIAANHADPGAAQHPWDAKDYRMPGGTAANPKIASGLSVAPAMLKKQTRGLYPAPEAILACMVEGSIVDFETALRIESRYLVKLLVGGQREGDDQHLLLQPELDQERAVAPGPIGALQAEPRGRAGRGHDGCGHRLRAGEPRHGHGAEGRVARTAEPGKAYSAKVTQPRVDKGRLSAAGPGGAARAHHAHRQGGRPAGLRPDHRGGVRKPRAQGQGHAGSRSRCSRRAASSRRNTSTLPISGLAKASAKPEKFIGIHFFSPVDKMKLVEIIRGKATDDETVARAFDYVQAIGKTPIVVNDSRGFFTSRVFGTFVMEGAAMLGEGIPAPVIEQGGLQAGMPVGPLAVIDETSLTLSVHVLDQTRADLAAEGKTYVATPGELLIERMVKEYKRGGRAAGGGFYDYPAGAQEASLAAAQAAVRKARRGLGPRRK